jgi:SAM-dependent methyltransferase
VHETAPVDPRADEYGPASYGDAFADVYDEWYADVSDVGATVDALARLAGDGPVLELGIGSGRIALPLARRGVDVWGIDASTAMLDLLRAKPGGESLPVAVGDMADVDLSSVPGAPAGFAVVFVALNTFLNLVEPGAQRRCLERSRAALAPGGRLVIEAFVPDSGAPRSAIELRTIGAARVVLTVTRVGASDAVVRGEHVEIDAHGSRSRAWAVRLASPGEIDAMAAEAGLRLVERWAGWHGEPSRDGDPVHVSVYGAR